MGFSVWLDHLVLSPYVLVVRDWLKSVVYSGRSHKRVIQYIKHISITVWQVAFKIGKHDMFWELDTTECVYEAFSLMILF